MYLKLTKWDGVAWMHRAKITSLLIYILFVDYMKAISVAPNKRRQVVGLNRIMNGNGSGRKWLWLNLSYYP
jgi:hypothetical protein